MWLGRLADAREPSSGRGRLVVPLLALVAYACLSVVVFGRSAIGDLQHVVEGSGQSPLFYGRDQSFYVWALAWTARSVTHLENPLITHEVFAPVGYNLTWAASIIGPALLIAPVTLLFGAVASYNLLAVLAPATAAWTAFLLCRHVTGRPPAAFAGGLLFGFCTYESAEMVNHLSLALVALLPLAVLLVLRRYAGLTTRRRFIVLLGVVLALQLWTASEVFASMVMFGVLAFLLGVLLGGRDHVPQIRATVVEALGALGLALVLAGPYLYYALRFSNPVSGISGVDGGADLANFVVPTQVTWLHGTGGLAAAAARLGGNLTEQLAYVGVPLLVILVLYAIEFGRSLLGRCLLAFIIVATIASLGAHAVVAGHRTSVTLPWSVAGELPLLHFASPGRFILYTWLAVAVAVSCWLARPARAPARWAALALVLVSLAPNVTGAWGTRVDAPALLAAPTLARYVPADSTVLALPFGIAGNSMFWQVQTSYRFRLAGGYVSVSMPSAYRQYIHLIRALEGGGLEGPVRQQICAFIRLTGTTVILLRDHAQGHWVELLSPLRVRPLHSGGFSIYELDRPSSAC
jgi:hypothetical protein